MSGVDPLILAQSDSDPTVKIIVGVVVAAFWIIAQVIGAMSKKPDQTLPPSRSRERSTDAPPMPPRTAPQRTNQQRTNQQQTNQRQTPPPRNAPQPPPVTGQPQRIKRQKPPPARRQPPPRLDPAPPIERRALLVPPAEAIEAVRPASTSLRRRQVLGMLLQTQNLKKAYALTEILQPPVALRPDADRSNFQ